MQQKHENEMLLEVRELKVHFPIRRGFLKRIKGWVRAVDGISLVLGRQETLGLVGESGCGKTTAIRAIIGVLEPSAGEVLFLRNGDMVNLATLGKKQLRDVRREIRMVFQDPHSSLNPRITVRDVIGEPLRVHGIARGKALDKRVRELMEMVGLDPSHMRRYPHAFSGGQRQRIGVARALALDPRLLLADEPTSALDVSVQAQVLNLFLELQKNLGLSYVFISHDLSVIRHISDRIAVMYTGKIVETAQTVSLFSEPGHPYTEALLSAVPQPDPHRKTSVIILPGEVPDPANLPSGCSFHPRCKYTKPICSSKQPALKRVADGHHAACHFAGELNLKGEDQIKGSASRTL